MAKAPTKGREPQGPLPSCVLGLDPGSHTTGYGILHIENGKVRVGEYGTLQQKKSHDTLTRMYSLAGDISELLRDVGPCIIAIESAFVGPQARAGLVISEARGVVIGMAAHHGIQIFQYAPKSHKKTTTGQGNASKTTVRACVEQRLKLANLNENTSDAFSIAMHHVSVVYKVVTIVT